VGAGSQGFRRESGLIFLDGSTVNSKRRRQDVLEFLLNNREKSSAQLLQDLFVICFSKGKKSGYFVEFGATDGISHSNTYRLEKDFDWQGILAEPSPVWHERLRGNRNCHIDTRCVYSKSNEIVQFRNAYEYPDLSGIEKNLQPDHNKELRQKFSTEDVSTVSLTDLLKNYNAPNSIDYLSIDTEGSELEILSAFDFSAFKIALLTVEHNFVNDQRDGLKTLLERNGFVRVFEEISRWDDWYLNTKIIGDAFFYRS
jgi:FkbM family methyltransferase